MKRCRKKQLKSQNGVSDCFLMTACGFGRDLTLIHLLGWFWFLVLLCVCLCKMDLLNESFTTFLTGKTSNSINTWTRTEVSQT